MLSGLALLSVACDLAVNFEVYNLSALTKELRTLVAFLTRRFVCVCVQAVRSQDLLSLILGHSLRNCMR